MMVWSMLLLPVWVPTLPLPLLSDMDPFLFVDPDPTHIQFFTAVPVPVPVPVTFFKQFCIWQN